MIKELLEYPEYRPGDELDEVEIAQQDCLIEKVVELCKTMTLNENCEAGNNAEIYGEVLEKCQEVLYEHGYRTYYPYVCYDDDNDVTLVYSYWDPHKGER